MAILTVTQWNTCDAPTTFGSNRRKFAFDDPSPIKSQTQLRRTRAPRRTRLRNNREEFFSSARAAVKPFHEIEVRLCAVVNFGISQRKSARASAKPILRFSAVSQHSRAR